MHLIATTLTSDEYLRRARSLVIVATGCGALLLVGLSALLAVIPLDRNIFGTGAVVGVGALVTRASSGWRRSSRMAKRSIGINR